MFTRDLRRKVLFKTVKLSFTLLREIILTVVGAISYDSYLTFFLTWMKILESVRSKNSLW